MGRLLLALALSLACCVSCTGFYTDDLGQFADEEDFGYYEGSGDFEAIDFFSSMLEFHGEGDKEFPPLFKCVRCTSVHLGGCDLNNLRQKDDVVQECPGQCLNISSGEYFAYDCAESLMAATGCTENMGMTMCLCAGDLCNAPPGFLPLPQGNGTVDGNSTAARNSSDEGNRTTHGQNEEDYIDDYRDYHEDYIDREWIEDGEGDNATGTPVHDLDGDASDGVIMVDGDEDDDDEAWSKGKEVSLDLQLPRGHSAAPPSHQSTMLASALNTKSSASHMKTLTPHFLWLSLLCVHSAVS